MGDASLACRLDGPIGETPPVVADGQTFVFTRKSLLGSSPPSHLMAHAPYAGPGDFNAPLHRALDQSAALRVAQHGYESEVPCRRRLGIVTREPELLARRNRQLAERFVGCAAPERRGLRFVNETVCQSLFGGGEYRCVGNPVFPCRGALLHWCYGTTSRSRPGLGQVFSASPLLD